MISVGALAKAARKAKKLAATAALRAGNMTSGAMEILGSPASKIAAFKAAFPGGSAPMSPSMLGNFGISPSGLAGKFMTKAKLAAFNLDSSSKLKTLGAQVGKIRKMSFASTKSDILGKAAATKSAIKSSLISKLGA